MRLAGWAEELQAQVDFSSSIPLACPYDPGLLPLSWEAGKALRAATSQYLCQNNEQNPSLSSFPG